MRKKTVAEDPETEESEDQATEQESEEQTLSETEQELEDLRAYKEMMAQMSSLENKSFYRLQKMNYLASISRSLEGINQFCQGTMKKFLDEYYEEEEEEEK